LERQSAKFTEKYTDYIHLGVIEWRKAYAEHEKMGKKAILFVMTDDTHNCDDVAEYLDGTYPDLKDAVLVIHTKNNGEISESTSGKSKEELDELRKQASSIDGLDSPYKAIISVMVLKEGWDVRNVTTIVGLRAYSAKSNILPEQTLGRGLRKMYPGDVEEYVSVVGTNAFMEFVESIQVEGVVLERKPMGEGTQPKTPLVVEIDNENTKKDMEALDIEIPVLTPRVYREYKNLGTLDVSAMPHQRVAYQQFSEEQQREIVFKDVTTGEVTHTTILDTAGIADYSSVIGYFAQTMMKDLRLVSGYDVLYGKVKSFVQTELFDIPVELESPNTLRNLSELAATCAGRYLLQSGGNPVPAVHAVTAPAALRMTLPYLPDQLARPSYDAVRQVCGTLLNVFTSRGDPSTAEPEIDGDDPAAQRRALERAVELKDEHAIKIAEAARREYADNPDPRYFAAAHHAWRLLGG